MTASQALTPGREMAGTRMCWSKPGTADASTQTLAVADPKMAAAPSPQSAGITATPVMMKTLGARENVENELEDLQEK